MATTDPLYIFPNLGMGDNLVCNGIARHYAAREEHVIWVAGRHYGEAVQEMLSDLRNLHVIDGYDYSEIRQFILPIAKRKVLMGYFSNEKQTNQWDEGFYQQAGVDFEMRWSGFDIPEKLKPPAIQDAGLDGMMLIHDIPERGVLIDPRKLPNLPGLRIRKTASGFWDFLPWIYSVRELHFINSSYLNLAESLYALGYLHNTRLVFHRYVTAVAVPPVLRAPWVIL